MNALSPADRMKLARVLGMLGSNHAGERDAAGLAADRIVRGAGLSWGDLLQPVPAAEWLRPPPERRATGEVGARQDVRFCGRYFDHLTDWEKNFVRSVSARAKFTERQGAILKQAADRLRGRGFA